MKLYQIPGVAYSTMINIDNINFITADRDKDNGQWCVYIYFAQGFNQSMSERICCNSKAEAEELYAKIVMDINDLSNL